MSYKYLYKNLYTIDTFISFENKVPVHFDSRLNTFSMKSNLVDHLDTDKFHISDSKDIKMSLEITYDENIRLDGYLLSISQSLIKCSSSSERGMMYAMDALNDLAKKENNVVTLPVLLIEDEPSFELRGIIEGYYGTPWSFQDREDMFVFMREHRLNSYMYAPKSDPYHREKWCDLYPESILNEFKNMLNNANNNKIDFWYTISPGYIKEGEYAFNFIDENDFDRLYRKIDQLFEIGIVNFGLLLDDIDYSLDSSIINHFERPGLAHAHICNKLYTYIASKYDKAKFVMCPTEYHQIGKSLYRNDLKENLNENIKVFFTGDNVCAEAITTRDMLETTEAFGKELLIWDNYPVSDFKYGTREFLGPIRNRTVDLGKYASGYFINPSISYHISKPSMITMADYAWNSYKYIPSISHEKSLDYIHPNLKTIGKDFIDFNSPSVLTRNNEESDEKLILDRNFEEIKTKYKKLSTSASNLLEINNPFIKELKPWLESAICEQELAYKIIANTATKDDVKNFLSKGKFLGSRLIDMLIQLSEILTDEEYEEKVLQKRGREWYRVFEKKLLK